MALFFQRMAEGHSVDWLNVYMHFKEVCIILGGLVVCKNLSWWEFG